MDNYVRIFDPTLRDANEVEKIVDQTLQHLHFPADQLIKEGPPPGGRALGQQLD